MTDGGSKSSKDLIDNYVDDLETIKLIMEAHDLPYEDAAFLWNHFLKTVSYAKAINERLNDRNDSE